MKPGVEEWLGSHRPYQSHTVEGSLSVGDKQAGESAETEARPATFRQHLDKLWELFIVPFGRSPFGSLFS